MPFALDLTTEHRHLRFSVSKDENSIAVGEIGKKPKKRKFFGRGQTQSGHQMTGRRLAG
jgi:hypothetical protein